jgi:hypothetical protein
MNVTLKSLLPPIDFGWNHVRARCGVSTCHNKLLTRAVPHSRIGIHMGQQWYCSADCFAAAIRIPLAVLSRERLMDTARNPRLSLGLVMLSKGYLTEDQLRLAVSQSRAGEPLEDALVRLGLASDRELAAARAAQWGFPVLGQDGSGLTVQVDLPKTFLQGFAAAPVHYAPAAKRLLLGFVHQVDHSFLHAIEQIIGCRPEPCFMTPAEFEAQMRQVTAVPDYVEVVVDEPGTPAQMARTLGGFAVEVGAREASVVRCKSWVWARLSSKRRTMDILFAMKNAVGMSESRELIS